MLPLAPSQRAAAAEQAREDLERYFRSSTSWRSYAHAQAIAS